MAHFGRKIYTERNYTQSALTNLVPEWVTIKEREYIFQNKNESKKPIRMKRKTSSFECFFGISPSILENN